MKTFREILYTKFNAPQLFVLSFALIIFVGSILLTMPFCNNGSSAPYIDNLFTAVSATCVTGLVTVVPYQQYSVLGQIVIIFLMQAGGLGLMTLVAIAVVFLHKKLLLKEKKALKDYLNKPDMSNFNTYIRSIYGYTFIVESIGALLLMIRFIPKYGFFQGIFNSFFISVSAFCNAGFDNIAANSLIDYVSDPLVNLTVMALIVLGGLGFIVWFDIYLNRKKGKKLNLHTKIVLVTTLILIVSGAFLFFIFEYNNTLAPLPLHDKIMASFFQSITYRTAGFATIDFAQSLPITRLIGCLYMYIGGSPGSCAGGMKTTTFIILIVAVISMIKNSGEYYSIWKRQLSKEIVIKALIIFAMYLSVSYIALAILLISEPLDSLSLFFEVVSAICTVGLTCGITTSLSVIGKIVIITLMLIGRIGPITIVLFFVNNSNMNYKFKYPKENVLIG
ncbi:MAG: TrkH family potassium uptake protein [Erysipelotrichaceae bacterium]|nr:TrkH family potassium uptake protein [Erysipelotrichaceae bacterium]MDY5251351.1 TrkH family potassium uptake protein [Erysipelotrichaceae bacterium]